MVDYKKLKAISFSVKLLRVLLEKELRKNLRNNPKAKQIRETIKKGEEILNGPANKT